MWRRRERVLCISLIIPLLFSIATINITPVFANQTKMYVDPPIIIDPTLTPPKTFTINVTIANVNNMYGYEFQLFWDRTLLNCTAAVDYPPFSSFFPAGPGLQWDYNATHGRYFRGVTCTNPGPPPETFSGNTTVTTLSFEVLGIGSSALDLSGTKLSDPTGTKIDHTAEDGYFNNLTPAKLYVDPPSIINTELIPCKNFTINITVLNVINLYSWEFKLYYNNDILNGTDATEGPFLGTSGPTQFDVKQFDDDFNATHGLAWIACTLLAPPPVSGNGTLATIIFHVEGLGESVLDLNDTSLNDPWNVPIPHSTFDGYFNNVLMAHLYVDPPSIIDPALLPPSNFTVNINVANITTLYAYDFKMGYDTGILNCLGVIITPFENETNFITEIHVDDEVGSVWVNVTYYSPAEPLTTTEPVTLATIYFQVASMGCSVLDLHDTKLTDFLGAEIPHDVSDGYICVLRRDVAVINVTLNKTMVYEGRIVYINVTVANEGDLAETFNVSSYYDDILIGKLEVVDLAPSGNTTLTFTWDTTGVAPCNNYTIKAEADVVPYETDIADNLYIDGDVKIKMLGDINGDGIIDVFDLSLISVAYQSRPGYPNWDPEADVNGDELVDVFDLVIVGRDYGKTC